MTEHGKYSALNPNNPCFARPTVEVENIKLRAEVERLRTELALERTKLAAYDDWVRDNPRPEGEPIVTVPVRVSGDELLARYRNPKPEGGE